jgi:hypothetical protein
LTQRQTIIINIISACLKVRITGLSQAPFEAQESYSTKNNQNELYFMKCNILLGAQQQHSNKTKQDKLTFHNLCEAPCTLYEVSGFMTFNLLLWTLVTADDFECSSRRKYK